MRIDGGTNGPVRLPLKNLTRCQPSPGLKLQTLVLRDSHTRTIPQFSLVPSLMEVPEMKISSGFTGPGIEVVKDDEMRQRMTGQKASLLRLPHAGLGSTFPQEHDRRDGKSYFK